VAWSCSAWGALGAILQFNGVESSGYGYWSSIASLQSRFTSGSCPATGACGAAAADGNLTFGGGRSWSAYTHLDPSNPDDRSGPTSISCPVSGTCAVVDGAGRAFTINQGATTMTAGATPSSADFGQSITYSATVDAVEPLYGAPTGTVTFRVGSTTLCTATLSGGSGSCASAAAPAGVDNVVATYSGDTHYFDTDADPANFIVSVAKPGPANQTITFGAPSGVSYGAADSNLGATASSGLDVSYASRTTGVCTIVSGKLHVVTAGSCTIDADQAGDAGFSPAPQVAQTFTIGQKTVHVDATTDGKTYGAPDPNVSADYLLRAADFVGLDDKTVASGSASCTLAAHSEAAGTYASAIGCDPSGLSAANYSFVAGRAADFTIAKADQTIGLTAPTGVTYGDADFGPGASASSGLTVGYSADAATPACTIAAAQIHVAGAGPCTVTGSQGGNANYNAAPDVTTTFTIAKKGQAISFAALAGKSFGDPPLTVSGSGGGSGNPVTFSVGLTDTCTSSGTNGATITITGAGSCTVSADQAGNSNYLAAASVARTFTIAKADQTIVFTAPTGVTYGDADFGPGASASSGLSVGYTSKSAAACTIVAGKLHVVAAGTCTIDANQPGNANYNAAAQIERTFPIAKAALAVTAEDKTVQYSDHLPALTAAYSGFVSGEGTSALSGALVCTTTASTKSGQVTSPAGTYSIACSGWSSANYVIANNPGTLTVTREDALARLAQNNPHAVQVDTSGANKGKAPAMTFTARITERSDGSYGDIAKASPVTFTLTPIGSGGTTICVGSVTQVQPASATAPGAEIVSCTVPQGTAINIYQVTVGVGGSYYQGSDDSVLSVYDPLAGGSNGAGTIATPNTGNKADFSYTAGFLKNGQVQGKFLYIQRDPGGNAVHILKGNVMSTMAISGNTATVAGKATLDGVGNYSYVISVVDNGNPNPAANPDQYGQRVSDSAASVLADMSFSPVAVGNGNVFVGK
jgi:hypothetical protein